jgi:hypothetical protein
MMPSLMTRKYLMKLIKSTALKLTTLMVNSKRNQAPKMDTAVECKNPQSYTDLPPLVVPVVVRV